MAEALQQDFVKNGQLQGDNYILHANAAAKINELADDHATFKDVVDELKLDYTALLADVTAIRTQVLALIADMATRISNFNTLTTKLNADAGVTDTNYAAAGAITAVNPAALTATAIAASSPATLATAAALVLTKG